MSQLKEDVSITYDKKYLFLLKLSTFVELSFMLLTYDKDKIVGIQLTHSGPVRYCLMFHCHS